MTRASCKQAWGPHADVAGGEGSRAPLALATWVTCSRPLASLLHTRQSELSSETIHSACRAAH